jgi:hypothetical protein
MAEPTRTERLERTTPEAIEEAYRRGYITAASRDKLLREKARTTVAGLLEEKGFFGAVFAQTMKNLQAGWDNLKEAAIREPTSEARTELYFTGLAVWGEIQVLTSAFAAVGEVTGQVAENWALRAGASPGLARVINIATDVGTGVVPVGGAVRSGAKGVQAIGKRVGAKTAAKAAVAEGAKASQTIAAKALADGLAVEGAETAAKVVTEATQAAVKPATQVAEGAAREAGEATTKAAPEAAVGARAAAEATETVQEVFARDLGTFQQQMAKVTATQAHEQTARLAAKLGLNLEDLRNVIPGQALDEKQMFAYLKALEPQIDRLIELARAAVTEGTEAATNALARHASEVFTVAPIFRGAEVTAGRAVEILKETPPMKRLTDLLMGWDPEAIAKGDFQGAMRTLAEDLVALGDDKAKLTQMVTASHGFWQRMGERWWPMAREFYTNLLLARPITWTRQMVGNAVAGGTRMVERELAGWLSIDEAKGAVRGEGWYDFKGRMLALGNGIKAFGDSFRNVSPEEAQRLDFLPHRIPGLLGRITNIPGDIVRGIDNTTRALARNGEYYATALRDGTHQGLTGKALAEFVARRVTHPTQAMMESGEHVAKADAFMSELGVFGERAQRFLQHGPLALYWPFHRSGVNLVKWGWDRTPGLQLISAKLYRDILEGGPAADMAIARLTLSNNIALFVFGLAQEGLITGGGPVDPSLRRSWLATHEPYAARGKDGWVPISNAAEPGTTPIELIADLAEILNQLDEPTAAQTATAIVLTIFRDLANNTWWRTLSDLTDIAQSATYGDPISEKTMRVVAGPLINVTTGGPLGAAIARAEDPIRRETRGFLDQVRARVFGYSKDLPALKDGYGDPVLPPQALGGPWVGIASPLAFRPEEKDRIKQEGARLQVRPPRFGWTMGGAVPDEFSLREPRPGDRLGVELTPQQRDRRIQHYRALLRHPDQGLERQLLENPLYRNQPRALQREMYQSLMSDYWQTAGELLLLENPALGKKVLESEAARVAPLLQREEQDALQEQLRETINLYDTLPPEQRENLLRWGAPPVEPVE